MCEGLTGKFCQPTRPFSDTVKGAKSSVIIYSIIETAKVQGHKPYAYLEHVFTQLPFCQTEEDYNKLLPFNVLPPSFF
jgi:transposase